MHSKVTRKRYTSEKRAGLFMNSTFCVALSAVFLVGYRKH